LPRQDHLAGAFLFMIPLILGPKDRVRAEEIVEHANKHKLTLEDLRAMNDGRRSSPGLDPDFVMLFQLGYKACYTVEIQEAGECEHLSVSIVNAASGVLPNDIVVAEIAHVFGIHKPFSEAVAIWLQHNVVNLMFLKTDHAKTEAERTDHVRKATPCDES
jgi:hypothetical protein